MLIGIDASRAFGDRLTLTGTERYSRELISAMLKIAPAHQHRFRLYVRDSLTPLSLLPQGERPGGEEGVEIIHIRQHHMWTHIGLARELAARPPDALFVPAHVLPASLALRSKKLPKIRSVVTIHDVGYRHFPQAHPPAQRLYLDQGTAFSARFASAIIVDSETTGHDLERFYNVPCSKVTIAYPGPMSLPEVTEAETCNTLQKFGLHRDQLYVLHVGTLQPRKNLRRLIRAWSIVQSQAPSGRGESVLILAGAKGWGGEDLQGEVNTLGLRDNVKFIGYISDVEKAALMRQVRAYAFPSLYEGFGFPVLEAQSVGVPVVCSNTSSLPEIAGDAALTFDPMNVEAIAAALERALFDEDVRGRLIRAGHQNIARFSWERCAATVLERIENRD